MMHATLIRTAIHAMEKYVARMLSTSYQKVSHQFMVLILGAVAICCLSACVKKELSQKPPSSANTPTFETKPSTIGMLATISITEIASLINSKIPSSFDAGSNGSYVCAKVDYRVPTPLGDIRDEKKVCAGTKYDFSASRTGDVTITPVGDNTIRMSLPVSFSGSGVVRGGVASAIKADKKNFKGTLVVDADLTPRLTEDWCPQIDASVTYRWTSEPKVEIVGGVWEDAKDQVEEKLNEILPELVSEAKKAIDCNKFRDEIAAVYGSKSFPVSIPSVGQIHINVQPTDIGFSSLKVEPTIVKAAALVTANVEAATTPLTPEATPLPKLKFIDDVPPRMSLNVPVRVSYADLTKAVSHAVAGKTFEQDTPVGKVVVKIKGAEIYPSSEKLVVGIDISADLPSSLLDTQGSVYLLATPKIENGTRVVLADSNYSQTLDNAFWSVVATLFEGQIRDAISKRATYDLTADFDKAKGELANKLNDPATIPGWKVVLNEVDMRVGRVAVADKELAVEGLFSALATIEPKR